ncbi:Hypothetical protein A7982_10861 [Minicystis rosea]|nr:Hypothetical protein A7982_10861 [Minicystis rosea]
MRLSTLGVTVLLGASLASCNLIAQTGEEPKSFGNGGASSSSGTGTVSVGGGGSTSSSGTGTGGIDAGPGPGYTMQALSFGDAEDQTVNAVAVGPNGHIFITGRGNGFTGFGCSGDADAGSVTPTGYLVELTAQGKCQWAFFFGGTGAEGKSIAVDADDSVYLVGNYTGALALPASAGPPIGITNSMQQGFIARFGPARETQWVCGIYDPDDMAAATTTAVATNGSSVAVAVNYGHSVSLLCPSQPSQPTQVQVGSDNMDAMVLLLEAGNGSLKTNSKLLIQSQSTMEDQLINGLALTSDGKLAVTGQTAGATKFNGAQIPGPSSKSAYVLVSKDNIVETLGIIPGDAAQQGRRILLAPNGAVYFAGEFVGTFGNADAGTSLTNTDGADGFLARVTGSPAVLLTATQFGSGMSQGTTGVAGLAPVGSSTEIVMAGAFSGQLGFSADTSVFSAGTNDIYVVKVDAEVSNQVWLKRFGTATKDQGADGVAVDPDGNTIVVGHFNGDLDFGNGTKKLQAKGKRDIFVAKLAP